MENYKDEKVNIDLDLRECIVNEEDTQHGTFCRTCGSNQYNFRPLNWSCQMCPENANCSLPFATPLVGYWNSFPCSAHVQKCFFSSACKGINANELLNHFGNEPVDCNFSDTAIEWYSKNLCKKGYSGPLCGSCTNSTGKSSTECRECISDFATVLVVVISLFVLAAFVIFQIKGNLDPISLISERKSKKLSRLQIVVSQHIHWNRTANFETTDIETRNITQREIEMHRKQQENKKREFVELTKVAPYYNVSYELVCL